VTGVHGKQIVPKPYKREKSFYTSQWIPGENVRRPGPLLHPLIPPMSVVLATASADQELDSKAISKKCLRKCTITNSRQNYGRECPIMPIQYAYETIPSRVLGNRGFGGVRCY